MNKKLFSKFTVFALSTMAMTSQAKFITLSNRVYATTTGGPAADAAYASAMADVLDAFENQVNANAGTGTLSINQYFTGLANSTAMANSGLGGSYYNNFDYFTFGAGVGFAGQLADGKSLIDLKDGIQGNLSGLGAGASLMVGANAGLLFHEPWFWGFVDPTRLKGYLGLFFFPIKVSGIGSGDVTSVSAIGQYQLIPSQSLGLSLIRWNGVNISSGLRFAKFSLDASYSQTVTHTENVDVSGTNVPTTLTTPLQVDLSIDATTTTMPFEATTSIRFAYFLTLLAGTAFDVNLGSSKGAVTAPATNLTVDQSGSAFVVGNTTADVDIDSNYNGKGSPTFLNWRGIVGLQLEFGVGGVYLTVQKAILKPQYAANIGLNLFY